MSAETPNTLLGRLKGYFVFGSSAKRKRVETLDESEVERINADATVENLTARMQQSAEPEPAKADAATGRSETFRKRRIGDMSETELRTALGKLDLPTIGDKSELASRLTKAVRSFRQLENGDPSANGNSNGVSSRPSRRASGPTSKPPTQEQQQEPNRILKELASKRTKRISKAEYMRLTNLLKQGIRDRGNADDAPVQQQQRQQLPEDPPQKLSETAERRVTPIDVVRKLSGANNAKQPAAPAFDLSTTAPGETAFRLPIRKPTAANPVAPYAETLESSRPLDEFIRPEPAKPMPVPASSHTENPARSTLGTSPFGASLTSSRGHSSFGGFGSSLQTSSHLRQHPSFPPPATQDGWEPKRAKRRRVTEEPAGGTKRSDVAQRILETLGKMSTPLEDVRSRRAPAWATPSLALEEKTRSMKREAFERKSRQAFAVPSASLDLVPKINRTAASGSLPAAAAVVVDAEEKREVPAMTELKQRLSGATRAKSDSVMSDVQGVSGRSVDGDQEESGRFVIPERASPMVEEAANAVDEHRNTVEEKSRTVDLQDPSNEVLVDPRFMFTPPNAEPLPAGVSEKKFLDAADTRMDKFSFASGQAPPRQKRKHAPSPSAAPASLSFSLTLPAAKKAQSTSAADGSSDAGMESPRIKPVGLSFSLSSKATPVTEVTKMEKVEKVEKAEKPKEEQEKPKEKEGKQKEGGEEKVSSLFAKFLPAKDTWKCEACLTTQNPLSADKCLCCEAPRPGSSDAAGAAVAPAVKVDLSVFASTSETPSTQSSFSFAAKDPDKAVDASASTSKPTFSFGGTGSTSASTGSTAPFSFGSATGGKEEAVSKPAFSFGIASGSEKEKVKDSSTETKEKEVVKEDDQGKKGGTEKEPLKQPSSGFSFGSANAGSGTSSGFKFGGESSAIPASTTLFGTGATTTSTEPSKPKEAVKEAPIVAPAFTFGAGTAAGKDGNAAPFGQAPASSSAETATLSSTQPLFGAAKKGTEGTSKPEGTAPSAAPFTFGAGSSTPNPFGNAPSTGFKFGDAAASSSATSTKAETKEETKKEAPAAPAPFKFGAAQSTEPNQSKPAEAAPATTAASTGFTFGASATGEKQPAASTGFKFGATTSSTASTNPATTSTDAGNTSSNGIFKFGSTPSASATEAAKPAAAAPSQAFSFGSSTTSGASKPESETSGFKFGAAPATASTGTSNVFGQPSAATPVGTSTAPATKPAFAFGAADPSKPPAAPATGSSNPFGGAANPFGSQPSSGGAFQFGSSTAAKNGNNASASNASSGFGAFGAAPAKTGTGMGSFGAPPQQQQASTPFGGGAAFGSQGGMSFGGSQPGQQQQNPMGMGMGAPQLNFGGAGTGGFAIGTGAGQSGKTRGRRRTIRARRPGRKK